MPLIEKIEKNKEISQILITTKLSSSKIIKKLKFKKVIHQFFPIDTNFHSKKFLNTETKAAFFIDSEIWPNTIMNLHKKNSNNSFKWKNNKKNF